MQESKTQKLLFLILLLIASRAIPHPPNFTAMNAVAIFIGSIFVNSFFASILLFLGMLSTSFFLGFHSQMVSVYGTLFFIFLLGRSSLPKVLSLPLSSTLFFLIVNFSVWLLDGMYPMTWEGLSACYVAALPFFYNQMMGDLFFGSLLWMAFEGVPRFFTQKNKGLSGKMEEKEHSRA